MAMQLRKFDEIRTKDGRRLGKAHCLWHRTTDINPALRLYATYLHVVSFAEGDDYFVPVEYLAGRDANLPEEPIFLTVTWDEVQQLTWTRTPDFVARGQGLEEDLPEA